MISILIILRFFNITTSVAHVYQDARVTNLGYKVFKLYLLTTVLAVLNGIIISNLFASLFSAKNDEDDDGIALDRTALLLMCFLDVDGVDVELVCPKSYGKVTVDISGIVKCIPTEDVQNYNITSK